MRNLSASGASPVTDEKRETTEKGPEDVVDDLGFGLAQLRWILLAYMTWETSATVVSVGPIFIVFLATELGFSETQKAALATSSYIGATLGQFFGGILGDHMGRRPPIVIGFLLTGLVVLVTSSVSPGYVLLVCIQFVIGFTSSLGYPTSIALVSEITPKRYRMIVQAIRSVFYNFGLMTGAVIFVCTDPYYQHLHWRTIVILSSIPTVVMFAVSWPLLRESPTFLAKTGDHSGAQKVFSEMRKLNRKQNTSISYAQEVSASALEPAPSEQLSWTDRCEVIFGRRHFCTTVALIVNSFALNLALYGHMYAFPLISTAYAASSPMAPGWQSLIQVLIGFGVIFISIPMSKWMSRRSLFVLAWVIGIAGGILFAWSGETHSRRNAFQQAVYIVSQNSPGACSTFGFLVVLQLSVDAYPINVASTAAGVIMMFGNVGTVVSPFVFDLSGDVAHFSNFYMLIAAIGTLSLILALSTMSFMPHEESVVAESEEKTPLLSDRATHK